MTKIEAGIDRAASALFASAAGYAAYMGSAAIAIGPMRAAETAAVAGIAYFLCVRVLRAVQPKARQMPVPIFDLRNIDLVEPSELLLTDRFEPDAATAEEPLVLDDVLAELGPDSRVVRLFDPAAMPTPGQLNDRIERHLERGAPPGPPHDASQALHDALAELRQSLR